jgi:hypothetical protein
MASPATGTVTTAKFKSLNGNAWILAYQLEHKLRGLKDVVTRTADAYASHYGVSPQRCFSNRVRDQKTTTKRTGFQPADDDCLRGIQLIDRLYIFAHGNDVLCGDFDGKNWAIYLHRLGVTEVGVINFSACDVGVGDFLDRFVIQAFRLRMLIGWVRAYRGTAVTEDDGGRPRQVIRANGTVLPKDRRVRVRRGTLNPATYEALVGSIGSIVYRGA